MKSKKGTVAAIAVIIVLVGIVCIGLLRDFDAQGYVRAILNQRFLGDVTEAEEILEDTSKKELLKQYDEGIESFVSDYITNGVEIDSELEKKFVDLCKEIFGAMKYQVNEAEKISRKEYDVSRGISAVGCIFTVYHINSDRVGKSETKGGERGISGDKRRD